MRVSTNFVHVFKKALNFSAWSPSILQLIADSFVFGIIPATGEYDNVFIGW